MEFTTESSESLTDMVKETTALNNDSKRTPSEEAKLSRHWSRRHWGRRQGARDGWSWARNSWSWRWYSWVSAFLVSSHSSGYCDSCSHSSAPLGAISFRVQKKGRQMLSVTGSPCAEEKDLTNTWPKRERERERERRVKLTSRRPDQRSSTHDPNQRLTTSAMGEDYLHVRELLVELCVYVGEVPVDLVKHLIETQLPRYPRPSLCPFSRTMPCRTPPSGTCKSCEDFFCHRVFFCTIPTKMITYFFFVERTTNK